MLKNSSKICHGQRVLRIKSNKGLEEITDRKATLSQIANLSMNSTNSIGSYAGSNSTARLILWEMFHLDMKSNVGNRKEDSQEGSVKIQKGMAKLPICTNFPDSNQQNSLDIMGWSKAH